VRGARPGGVGVTAGATAVHPCQLNTRTLVSKKKYLLLRRSVKPLVLVSSFTYHLIISNINDCMDLSFFPILLF
jgi:hypothetical protein